MLRKLGRKKKKYDNLVEKCVPIREEQKKKKLPFMTKSTKKIINKRETVQNLQNHRTRH